MTVATRTRPVFYRHVVCADRLRRTDVLIGHPSVAAPSLVSSHWGGESGFQLRLLDDGPGWPRLEHHEGLTIWRQADVTARLYPTAGLTRHDEDGGFEFEVELARRPVSNVLRFLIRSVGLRFYFQPEGEPHVRGSYAVYHATRAGNFADVHYRAGKALHVYRPWAQDAAGRRVWCDLRMPVGGNGLVTVTVPSWFLDDAVYPVLVVPTFGYTTAGASTISVTNSQADIGAMNSADSYTATGGDTITKFSVYADDQGWNIGATIDLAAYTYVSGLPASRLAAGVSTTAFTGTGAWRDTAAVSQSPVGGTAYVVAMGNWTNGANSTTIYRDTAGANARSLHSASGALPATWTDSGQSTSRYSLYATYTAAVFPASTLIAPNAAVQRAANW